LRLRCSRLLVRADRLLDLPEPRRDRRRLGRELTMRDTDLWERAIAQGVRSAFSLLHAESAIRGASLEPIAEPTATDRLAAVLDHVREYDIDEHMSQVGVFFSTVDVQLYTGDDESAIAALRPWIESLDAETVKVVKVNQCYHLYASGEVSHGIALRVVSIAQAAESSELKKVITSDSDAVPVGVIYGCQVSGGDRERQP
jgi:hypothetical protein